MSSDFGSVFHFTGSISDMKMKISLYRIGPTPGNSDAVDGSSLLCDEVSCGWKERITRSVQGSYERPEPRIFTLPIDNHEATARKFSMDICAFLGDILDTDESHFHDYHLCRITAFGGGKTLVFEPPLTSGGFRLEGKLGDYVARIHIYDDGFSSLTEELSRMEIENFLDADGFEMSEENSIQLCYNITLRNGEDFMYDGIAVRWTLLSPYIKGTKIKGSTGYVFPNKNNWNYSYTFTVNLNISITDIFVGLSNPCILLEADSRDSWGRRWVAGYSFLHLPLTNGSTEMVANCWKPVEASDISKLREFFIGNTIEVDTDKMLMSVGLKMFGNHTETTGRLFLNVTTVVHSRHFMARDTIQQVKYGARLGQIGLRSDIYWRIVKVLLEFEEARQMLLKVRK